jgi:hypothetical protein
LSFVNEWKVEDGPSPRESERLFQYYSEKGGLVFREFNTTEGIVGRTRSIDAIRFPELKTGIYTAFGNYPIITQLIEKHHVELIEVHKWGFYGLGQLIGKKEIVEKYWNPKEINLVLITSNLTAYHPEMNPDPPTEEVFEKYGVSVYVPKDNRYFEAYTEQRK